MKEWEYWSIDCPNDDCDNGITISGDSHYLDEVEIVFPSGVTSGEYTITYNDNIRCMTYTYTVSGAPCSCTVTSSYPSTNAHSSAAETSSFVVGTINDSNCEEIIITYVEEESNGDWLSCKSLEIDENNNITSSGLTENDSDSTRYATYSFSCGGTLEFYQSAREIPDCPTDYLIGLASGNISAGGGEYELARFKNDLSDYTTALTVSMSDGSSATIADSGTSYAYDSSYNVIKVNVPQNTSTNSRTISVGCTLTHTGGTPVCTDTKTFTQDGTEPTPTCGCDSITFEGGTSETDPTP